MKQIFILQFNIRFISFNQCNFQYFNFFYAKEIGENVIRRSIGFPLIDICYQLTVKIDFSNSR